MRLLLDTHTVVWSILQVGKLSPNAKQAISDTGNTAHVSVASAWEIAIKAGKGKWPEAMPLIGAFVARIDDAGFEMLPITVDHVRAAGFMVSPHRDPFDRLLAAQAQVEGLTLVTADRQVQSLCAAWLW